MSSNTVTMIFCLGGVTFLANWIYLSSIYIRDKEIRLDSRFDLFKFLIYFLLVSILGVLATGVVFVSALMFAHG